MTEYAVKIIDESASKVIAEHERILSEIDQAAIELFDGDFKEASAWMLKPAHALGDRKPIDCLNTINESIAVLALLRRLEHGAGV